MSVTDNHYTILHKGLEHPEILAWGEGTAAVLEPTPADTEGQLYGVLVTEVWFFWVPSIGLPSYS